MQKQPKNKVNKQKIENKLPPSNDTKNAKVIDIDKKEEEMLKGQIHLENPIINEYILKDTIGKGSFSKVKLGINKITGEKVAIKIQRK